jgi:uncharacterized protein (TIGR00251 family)
MPDCALSLRQTPDGVEVPVRVAPKAKRSALAGRWRQALKVQVAAVPREGRANDELCAFLARLFGVPRRRVSVRKGEKSKDKIILVAGIEEAAIRSRLNDDSTEE